MFDILHGVRCTENSNMNEVRGPGKMDFTSPQNLSETWRRWKRGMEYYLTQHVPTKLKHKRSLFLSI